MIVAGEGFTLLAFDPYLLVFLIYHFLFVFFDFVLRKAVIKEDILGAVNMFFLFEGKDCNIETSIFGQYSETLRNTFDPA